MRKNATIVEISQKTFTEKSLLRFQEVEISDLINELSNSVAVLRKIINMCERHLGTYFKINETQIMMKIENDELKFRHDLNPTVFSTTQNILSGSNCENVGIVVDGTSLESLSSY